MTISNREPAPGEQAAGEVTRCGQEVLRNGRHMADAASVHSAEQIVAAFGDRESIALYLEREAWNRRRTRHVRDQLNALAGNVRAGLDRE